ncbi:MAG: hypothetical protein IJS08_14205 [Victivallales bacterium]|nr:hypothetical protein [Victivallales bacterium]
MLGLLKTLFGIPSTRQYVPARPRKTAQPATGMDWAALAKPDAQGDIKVYDPKGVPLRLKRNDEIARGGEGVIYRFAQNSSVLIKVCKQENLADGTKLSLFRRRLNAMMKLEECRQADFLAWPLMPVLDNRGGAIGFVMRKCTGRTLRALLAPVQVQRFFPGWNRLHVAQVALNFLDAVRMLARHKVLVNDFNPSNFLVDGSGIVRLIDCDSFQIPVENGNPFMTRTYTPEFAAPELLLHPELFDQPRTPEQVRFSLAVLIYMVLMSGLHPYARCGGGDPTENLKSGKCPLDKDSGVRMPVSWYKSVSWLTPGLKDCFLRMFKDGFAHPAQRPLLGELRNELVNFIDVMKNSKSENQRAILPTTAKRGK